MDNFRIKIQDFFNKKWLKSRKRQEKLSLSANMDCLHDEYKRAYNVKMSASQICEMLIIDEIERIKSLPDYCGIYSGSNLVRLKCEYKLVENCANLKSVELDENFNEIHDEILEDDEDFDCGNAFENGFNDE